MEDYQSWLKELALNDRQKEMLIDELERLIKKYARPQEERYFYFAGQVDAYNSIWKLISGYYDETDYPEII